MTNPLPEDWAVDMEAPGIPLRESTCRAARRRRRRAAQAHGVGCCAPRGVRTKMGIVLVVFVWYSA